MASNYYLQQSLEGSFPAVSKPTCFIALKTHRAAFVEIYKMYAVLRRSKPDLVAEVKTLFDKNMNINP